MTKQLDKRNETARARALKENSPQPFYKAFIELQKACPYCGEFLTRRRTGSGYSFMDDECECGFWTYELYPLGRWCYKPKAKINLVRVAS